MKLLIVDEEIITGGVETLRRNLVPALAGLADLIVWVLPGHAADDFCEIEKRCGNVIIEMLNSPRGLPRVKEAVMRRIRGGLPRVLVDQRLRLLARRRQCDVCMTTCVFGQPLPAAGVPVAGFVSDINPRLPEAIRTNIGKWVEQADMIFTVSDFISAELKHSKPRSSDKIHSVPLAGCSKPKSLLNYYSKGILTTDDTDYTDGRGSVSVPIREIRGSIQQDPMSGDVSGGRFYYPAVAHEHKGHLTLLEAARGLAIRRFDFRLTLTGPGMDAFAARDAGNEVICKMRDYLAAHRELFHGRILVAGDAPPAEVERLYSEATCVVLPSSYEGFGLPLAEALGYGKRVICSDIAPFREQIERYGCEAVATFVPVGDAEALEQAMAAHLAGNDGPGLTPAELSERIGRWTWQDAARRCLTLLEGIASHG